MDIELVDMAVSGSRCRGLEENSDLDVVVEYRGRESEDSCSMPLTRTVLQSAALR